MRGTIYFEIRSELDLTIPNATLSVEAPTDLVVRCEFPLEQVDLGSLPSRARCADYFRGADAQLGGTSIPKTQYPYLAAIRFDDRLPLTALRLYNFSLAIERVPLGKEWLEPRDAARSRKTACGLPLDQRQRKLSFGSPPLWTAAEINLRALGKQKRVPKTSFKRLRTSTGVSKCPTCSRSSAPRLAIPIVPTVDAIAVYRISFGTAP